MADAASIHLSDGLREPQPSQQPQTSLKLNRMISTAGQDARDITAEFTQAASGTLTLVPPKGMS